MVELAKARPNKKRQCSLSIVQCTQNTTVSHYQGSEYKFGVGHLLEIVTLLQIVNDSPLKVYSKICPTKLDCVQSFTKAVRQWSVTGDHYCELYICICSTFEGEFIVWWRFLFTIKFNVYQQ